MNKQILFLSSLLAIGVGLTFECSSASFMRNTFGTLSKFRSWNMGRLAKLSTVGTVCAMSAAAGSPKKGDTVNLKTWSNPISRIWFRHLGEHDLIVIKHLEGPKWFYLGEDRGMTMYNDVIVSNKDIYNTDGKLVRRAEYSRAIGSFSWPTDPFWTGVGPTAPALKLHSDMECRVRQFPSSKKDREKQNYVPELHMKCIKKSQDKLQDVTKDPAIEHNFLIQRFGGYKKRYPLSGALLYPEDVVKNAEGYEVIKKAHEFTLQDKPE